MPPEEIVSAQQLLWDQLAASYAAPLWAAAYMINGGCSDEGFDYFRGWLVAQGRDVVQRALTDPDSLADHPPARAASADWEELECEGTLAIAYDAYRQATGDSLPQGMWSINYPALGGDFWFEFEDSDCLAQKLPRLAALYEQGSTSKSAAADSPQRVEG